MSKIRILCYGDSNTWGFVPCTGERFDWSTRFPGALQKLLGENFLVVEDGLRGRNTGHDFEMPGRGNLNGAKTFPAAVLANDPLDFVAIMLGTNDLDERFDSNAAECAKILEEKYIDALRFDLAPSLTKIPKIIIIAPSVLTRAAAKMKDAGVMKKSLAFEAEYKKLAEKTGCLFVSNAGIEPGKDGIHLTAESHLILAKKLQFCIKNDE